MNAGDVQITRGEAPLLLAMPHTGRQIAPELEARLLSPWLARKDADWHIERLYAFAAGLGATLVRTPLSRTVIDVNRDPSGVSLYPGMATTELCPTTSFDGEPLYRGAPPDAAEIAARLASGFTPYHAALRAELERLRARHRCVVLYDCHAIRSRIPRLFDGELPQFNIGSNSGASCAPALTAAVADICAASGAGHVVDGRFKGGYTTRHYGRPADGVHAIQMELACRGYLHEPEAVGPHNWPPPYDETRAAPLQATLREVLRACLAFAHSHRDPR